MIRVTTGGESLRGLAGEIIEEEIPRAVAAVDKGLEWLEVGIKAEISRALPAAAAPGEPPGKLTGELLAAVSRTRARATPGGGVVSGAIRVDHDGANRLEYGDTDARGIKTNPHPFVRPIFEKVEPAIVEYFESL